MPFTLRDAWTTLVDAEDYELHMANIGQAQANAGHLADFIALTAAPPGAMLLIAGAGPGQMFDYIDPAVLAQFRPVFSDINPRFLQRLSERCPGARSVVDDIERTSIAGPFHAVMETLMLEHVDWRKGLAALSHMGAAYLYLVIQQNPPHIATAVSPARTPPGTMRIFASAHPQLLDVEQLQAALAPAGYEMVSTHPRAVADDKVMLGLLFHRK